MITQTNNSIKKRISNATSENKKKNTFNRQSTVLNFKKELLAKIEN